MVWILLFILILTLGTVTYYLYTEINSVKSVVTNSNSGAVIIQKQSDGTKVITKIEQIDTCGGECKEEIDTRIAEAIDGLDLSSASSTAPTSTPNKVAVVAPTKTRQVTYIPLSITATSTSTDWVDVDGAQAYVHKYADYGEDAYVEWEASLKVAHGNGKAFARLWDDTNKIAVNGSELFTENNSDFVQVKSGNLPFWNGNNLYKVQIKSLNGFEVTHSNGRIKIVY